MTCIQRIFLTFATFLRVSSTNGVWKSPLDPRVEVAPPIVRISGTHPMWFLGWG